MTLDKQFILTDEEIRQKLLEFAKANDGEFIDFNIHSRPILYLLQAQVKKTRKGIIDEAKKQGVFKITKRSGKITDISYGKSEEFWQSLLKGE